MNIFASRRGRAVCIEPLEARIAPATLTWDGSDSADWFDPDNWTPTGVPGANDTAVLNIVTTINLPSNTSVGAFQQSNGTFTSPVEVTFTVLNNFAWTGGTQSGAGTTAIDAGATLTLGTSVTKALLRTLTNSGTADWTGGSVAGSGTFNNEGVFNASAGNTFFPTFANAQGATFNQLSGITTFFQRAFDNDGAVNVNGGTLALFAGGTSTGSFTVATAATLNFTSGTHLLNGATISGAGNVGLLGSVTLDAGSTYNVTGTTTVSGGFATFDIGSTVSIPTLNMNSGVLAGSSNLLVTSAFNWTGGTMSGTGTTTIGNSATLTLSGTSPGFTRILINNGTTDWTGSNVPGGTGVFTNNGVFNASAGGLFVPAFTNASGATFNQLGGINGFQGAFNNHGAVNLSGGTLNLNGGVTSTHTGSFGLAQAAVTLNFAAGTHLLNGATIGGAGNVGLTATAVTLDSASSYNVSGTTTASGGTFTFNTSSSAAFGTLNQTGGTMTGSANLLVNSAYNWSAGTMSGAGTTTIAAAATLSLSGGSVKTLNRALVNSGNATWTDGAVGGTGLVTNNNLFTASAGNSFNPPFSNTASATLAQLAGTNTFTGAVTNGGTLKIDAGTLALNGGFTQTAGAVSLNGGAVSTTGALNFNGGELRGRGTVTGNVNNTSGTVQPGGTNAAGTLAITGTYTQGVGGTLAIELGGTVPGTEYDQLAIGGTATLGGTLNATLINGFVPANGARFQVLTASPRSGTFAPTNLPPGLTTEYNPNDVTLVASVSRVLTWDGSDSSDWFDADNWTPIGVPSVNDTAILSITSTINLTANAVVGSFQQSAGTLTGPGNLTILGNLNWTEGAMAGTGTTSVAGLASTIGGGVLNKVLNRTLSNSGTLTYSSSAGMLLGSATVPGVLNNSGTFHVTGDGDFFPGQANPGNAINNSGTWNVSGPAITSEFSGIPFNNSGTVNINSGTLRLRGGDSGTTTGDFSISSGATLRLDSSLNFGTTADVAGAGNVNFVSGAINMGGTYNLTGTSSFSGATVNFNTLSINSGPLNIDNGVVNFNSAPAAIAGITLSGSGTVNFNAAATTAFFTQTNGTLGGSGILSVTGNLNWTEGTMAGTGTTSVAGLASTIGGGVLNKVLNRTLSNSGTLTYSSSAGMLLGSATVPGVLNNSGTFHVTGDGDFFPGQANPGNAINNSGTWNVSGPAITSEFSGIPFNNSGTVNINSGTLRLRGGDSGTTTGDFSISSGATLRLDSSLNFGTTADVAGAGNVNFVSGAINMGGTYNLTGTSSFSGATVNFNTLSINSGPLNIDNGVVNFNSAPAAIAGITLSGSGTVNFNAAATTAFFTQTNGTLGGSGILSVTGNLNWTEGTMAGTGTTSVAGLASTIGGGVLNKVLNRTLSNSGTLTYSSSAGMLLGSATVPGVLNNSGTFHVTGDGDFFPGQANPGNAINNSGTWNVSGPAITSEFSGIPFNNSGTVNINSGTLAFRGGFTQTAGSTGLGGGALSTSTTMNFQAGVLTGAGTITGNVNNSGGIVQPGGPGTVGTISITGNYTQSGAGVLATELEGTGAGQFDTLTIGGNGTLGGTLNATLINGFIPASGATFQILTAAPRAGTFTTTNLPPSFTVQNNPNNVTLVAPVSTVFTWDGSDSADWFDADNWTPAGVPGATDTAILNIASTISVFSNAAVGAFQQSAGTLSGGAVLTVINGLAWSGGTIMGQVATAAGSTSTIGGGATKTIVGGAGGVLENFGALTWSGAGNIELINNSSFANRAGGTITATNDAQLVQVGGGASSFVNAGSFVKDGGVGTTSIAVGATTNTGTFEARTGTLRFDAALTSSGVGNAFNAGPGGTIRFAAANQSFTDTDFSGLGAKLLGATGSQTLSGAVDATNLEFAGPGILNGTSTITGSLRWSGGTILGAMTIAAGSALSIEGAGTKVLVGGAGGVIDNFGAIMWSGTGDVQMNNNAMLTNRAGATFTASNDAQLVQVGGGASSFSNAGTFTKGVGAGTTTISIGSVLNTGLFDVQAGTVAYTGGVNASGAGNGFSGQAGTAITFAGNASFTGTAFNGAGAKIFNGSTLTLTGNIAATNLTIAGTTWTGTSTITGDMTWSAGTLLGAVTIPAGSTLTISGAGVKSIIGGTGGALTNAGAVNFTSTGALEVNNSAALTNQAGATFTTTTDAAIHQVGGGSSTFTNEGAFIKAAGAGTSNIEFGALTNSGTFTAQSGVIALTNFAQTGGATVLDGGGFVTSGTMNFQGGELRGSGTITGNVNNTGATVRPGGAGAAGLLTITGAYTQSGSGVFAAELGGTGAGQFDVLSIGGTATLGGTLNAPLINGFTPANGATFQILTAAPRSGTFTTTNLPPGFTIQNNPNNVTLAAPVSTSFTWDGSDSTDWFDADNWTPTGVPGASDTAILQTAQTIALASDATVGVFQQSAGTLSAANGATFTVQTSFDWTAGTQGGAGTTSVNGALTVSGGFGKTLGDGGNVTRTLVANGTTTIAAVGTFFIGSSGGAAPGAQFINNGTLTLLDNAGIGPAAFGGTGGRIVNTATGIVNKVGAAVDASVNVRLENSGIVNVDAGTLSLQAGGTSTGGTFAVDAGTTLRFAGNSFSVAAGSTFGGAGSLVVLGNLDAEAFGFTDVTISGGNLDLNALNVTVATLNHLIGNIIGSGTLTVSGPMTFGTIAGFGGSGTTIANGGLTITGSASVGDGGAGARTFINNGAATLNGTLNLVSSSGGVASQFINNAAFDVQTGGINGGLPNVFINAATGVFNKTGAALTAVQTRFENAGLVNVDAGTFALQNGGLNTSTFAVDAGTTLQIQGGAFSVAAGSTFGGAGSLVVLGNLDAEAFGFTDVTISGGNLDLNALNVTVATLNHLIGNIIGSGTLTVSGPMTFGTIAGFGGSGTTIANGGLTITGSTSVGDGGAGARTFINNGAATLNGTLNLTTSSGGVGSQFINNGTFDAPAGSSINGSPPSRFVNSATGTFTKASAGLTQVTPLFENAGALTVSAGTLGNFNAFAQTGGTTTLAGGTLSSGNPLLFQGGVLTGAGTITGSVNNSGAIIRLAGTGAAGTLAITGTYTQGASGTLATELGGTGAGQFDVLSVGGTATLGGTLNATLINGFAPASGATFQILSAAPRAGTFTTTNLPTGFTVQNNPNNVTLVAPATQIFTWDGSAGNQDWFTPANWTPDGIPGAPDTAVLGINSTINLSSSTSVGTFQQSAGTLTSATGVTFNVVNSFDWSGGTQAGSGSTTLGAGAALTLSGAAQKTLDLRALSAAGGATWTGAGNLVFINNPTLAFDGTFAIQTDADLTGAGTLDMLGGLLRKETTAGETSISALLANIEDIVVAGGTLTLAGGGNSPAGLAPHFTMLAGATLRFASGASAVSTTDGAIIDGAGRALISSGDLTLGGGSNVASGTTVRIDGGNLSTGGTVTYLPGSVVEFANGSLNGFGPSGNHLIRGAAAWTGGTMAGVTIGAGGVLHANGGDEIAGPFRNDGTFNVDAGFIVINGAQIVNAGLFDLRADVTIPRTGAAPAIIDNLAAGIIRKSAGAGTATITGADPVVTSAGLVEVLSGTLDFGNSLASSGVVALAGGNISGVLNLTGGELRSAGPGTITGSVNNSGATVRPGGTGAAGTLAVTGTYTQGAGGSLNVELGGSGAGQFDVLSVSGTATLGGTLNVTLINGFVPPSGATFQALTATPRTGTFTTTNLPSGFTLQNNPNNVTLVAPATQIFTWDGSDSTDWFDADNWTPMGVPGATDTAILNNGLLPNQPVLNANTSVAVFQQTAGRLDGSGTLTVLTSFEWMGGRQEGTGATTVNTGATATIGGAGLKELVLRGLNLSGPATFSGTGDFDVLGGAQINNSVLFDIQSDADLTGGGGIFNNLGGATLRKSVGVAETAFTAVLNNSATVQALTGTLRADGGGSGTAGVFSASPGATFDFGGGTHTLSGATSFTGGGVISVSGGMVNLADGSTLSGAGTTLRVNGGTVSVAGTVSAQAGSNVDLSAGTIAGTGTLSIAGAFNWTGGDQTGAGATTTTPGAITTIGGAGAKTLTTRTLNLAGTTTLGAGTGGFFINGGTINNSGIFEITAPIGIGNLATGGTINNQPGATFRSSVSSGSAFVGADATLAFNNAGAVEVLQGTLTFRSSFTQTAGRTALMGAGSTIDSFGGNTTFIFQGGTLTGIGTIAAPVSNTGATVAPGNSGPGILTLGSYTQGAGGTLVIEIGGTTAGSQFDRLVVSGAATLGGTINATLINGFAPASGATFAVLTAVPRNGTFTTENLPPGFTAQYNGGNVTIVAPVSSVFTWDGSDSTDWFDADNWTPSGVPGASDTAILNSGALPNQPLLGANTSVRIFQQSAGTFASSAGVTFTVLNAFDWTGGGQSGAGSTRVATGATLNYTPNGNTTPLTQHTLELDGTTIVSGTFGGDLAMSGGATINNRGLFDIQNGVSVTGSGAFNNLAGATLKKTGNTHIFNNGIAFTNAGTVQALGGTIGFSGGYTQTGGSTEQTGGAIAVSGTLNLNGGVLAGTGSFVGSINNSGGIIRPAGSGAVGTITTNGDYTQGPGGTLETELAGTGAGQFDVFAIGGVASLAGTLTAPQLAGFTPPAGSEFQVLTTGSVISGTFTNAPGNVGIQYAARGIKLLGPIAPPSTVVTTTLDVIDSNDGVTSLREAITFTNSNPGVDTITFNIPAPGVQTIAVATSFPAISEAVVIDGYSQPGANANTAVHGSNAVILIELRSGGAPSGTDGLVFTADGNTVRGLAVGGFDGDGIELRSSGNRIEGSFIGLNAAGNAIVANGNPFVDFDAGIFVNDGSNNVIGGTTAAQRNVISGNNSHGVMVINGVGAGAASQNLIIGNVIGLAADGTTLLVDGQGFRGNRGAGVLIDNGAQNEIGGIDPGERNILSGNQGSGVTIQNSGATANLVQGNLIGLAADGVTAAGNGTGVGLSNAPGNMIGGATVAARNIISANSTGVAINGATGGGNLVQGNFIGTDITGTLARGNTNGVVVTESPNNSIGGLTATPGAAPGNLISGNTGGGGSGNGVLISGANGTGNRVQGNNIGLDLTGTLDLGNDATGVAIGTGGSMTLVGGTDAGARNVISGNRTGITMSSGFTLSSFNVIRGNFIGTDITGTLDLGNDGEGIFSNASDHNTVGGTTPEARNVISGNGGAGINLMFARATDNVIQGNYIGTDATGTLDLGNSGDGVFIDRASRNTVGGSATGAGNVISGNDRKGIVIGGPSIDGTMVQGNLIGTQASGSGALGNGEHGVLVTSFDVTNTLIGGPGGAGGNMIAFNGGSGVFVEVGTGMNIRGNTIHSNAGLGIDLGTAGVTLNDPGDADTGPNNLQNFPVLLSAVRSDPAGLAVTGTVQSSANATFTIEFFVNGTADPSGFGEGQIFLGDVVVITDGNGDGTFSFNSPAPVAAGQQISATATSATGDTSEFSQTQTVTEAVPTISIADAANLEGQAGTSPQSFAITLSAASMAPVSVLVSTADGSATAGSDFTALNGQLVQFAPGETTKLISVDLLGDAVIEANETFSVLLSGSTNATIADGSATGTIINDDVRSPRGDDVIFTDADGDEVTVALSKGNLAANALVFEPTAQGFVLRSVDLTPDGVAGGAINGTSLSINAKLRPGGDGRVNVGRIDSTGIILKKLKIDGDVGLIEAGAIGSAKPAIKEMRVVSLGTEQDNLLGGSPAGMLVQGGIGRIKVLTDVLNFAASIGVGQPSSLKQMVVGGQMTGSQFEIGGGFDSLKVKGVLENTDFEVGENFQKISVAQQVTGGSFMVGGILGSATFKNGLKNTTFNASQAIGTLIVLRDVETSTVRAGTTLANFIVGGSLVDSTVTAPGKLLPRNAGDAMAFKIVGVQEDVVRSQVLAGYDRDGMAVNPDAGIGKVVIKGTLEASSIVAGASAGADGFFGNADDALLTGGNEVVARIASIMVKGAVVGTSTDSADHFGIVAEELGKVKTGGVSLPLSVGPRNDLGGFALGGTGDVRAREVS